VSQGVAFSFETPGNAAGYASQAGRADLAR
jgi:hypothetical protein